MYPKIIVILIFYLVPIKLCIENTFLTTSTTKIWFSTSHISGFELNIYICYLVQFEQQPREAASLIIPIL